MNARFKFLALMTVLTSSAFAHATTNYNVILMTLDGVRLEEVMKPSSPIFSTFLKDGVLLGNENSSWVQVSNHYNKSLPGYQNIFAGHPTGCRSNDCERTNVETLPEFLANRWGLTFPQSAGFASWGQIPLAYEHIPGTTFINAGNSDVTIADTTYQKINVQQNAQTPPWNANPWSARYDQFTFAHALHFLKTNQPRFLYIGLLDSDEYAHAKNRIGYYQALVDDDIYIDQIKNTLEAMGEYGKNTMLIVTTDHGRGKGPLAWAHHGPWYPHSKKIWLYLWGKPLDLKNISQILATQTEFTHNDIRPLIEAVLKPTP